MSGYRGRKECSFNVDTLAKLKPHSHRSADALGKLSVEEFMALSSSSDEVDSYSPLKDKVEASRKRKRVSNGLKTSKKSVRFYSSDSEPIDIGGEQSMGTDEEDGDTSSDDMGIVEPRPLEITSWKDRVSD